MALIHGEANSSRHASGDGVRGDNLPITAPQAGIWFSGGADGRAGQYNIGEIVVLEGEIDVPAFRRALERAMLDIDACRARFSLVDGVPLQNFDAKPALDFALVDVSAAAVPQDAARAEAEHLLSRPFDLERGPTHRDRLIKLAGNVHWWARTCHHIANDGLGAVVLRAHVAALYNAELGYSDAPSAPPPYREFVLADSAYPGTAAHAAAVAHWRKALAECGAPTVLSRHRRKTASLPGGTHVEAIASGRLAKLNATAQQLGVSLHALLLSAFLVLLARAGETEHPCCSLTLHNRQGRRERAMAGTFASTTPFGIAVYPTMRFSELAAAVRRAMRATLKHMRLAPHHMRAAGLDPWRGARPDGATFNAMDFPSIDAFHGLKDEVHTLSNGPVTDITLTYYNHPSPGRGAEFMWRYDPGRYEADEVVRLAERYGAVLDCIAVDPDVEVGAIAAMSPREQTMLAGWEEGPALAAPWSEPVHLRFARLAAAQPNAAAVSCGNRTAGYGALARAMTEVAARLRAAGVRDEAPVGLCLAASPELVAGFLGILAAGAAVVPLDPALPPARLAAMIEALGCSTVLSHQRTRACLPGEGEALRVFELDGVLDAAPCEPAVPAPVGAQRLACIYHTSGSTGRPKPVGMEHGALAARISSMSAFFGILPDERTCVASPIAFDPFLQQLFFALCGGGCAWMAEPAQLVDGAAFWSEIRARGITHLNLVPSVLEALLEMPPAAALPALRRVVVGGERMPANLPARVRALLGVREVWNMYGPTEATVDATGLRLDTETPLEDVPIGRPLPGCRIRILDSNLRRVPTGVVGELCIGGIGLARGYLGLEEATREKFVADPYGPPGARLYRTGDMAAWRNDGTLSFVGREDEQIKLRGQRIELGEIEAVLRRHAGVAQAAVLHEADGYNGRLVAYVAGTATAQELRTYLAQQLPAPAVPGELVRIESLPLLASGKLDRQALRARSRAANDTPVARPPAGRHATLQRAIAAVWCELLDRPSIDVDANLFEAGVYSLLIPRAQARISAVVGRTVDAVDLFRFPTVAALAGHLAGDPAPAATSVVAAPVATAAGERDIAIVGMAFRFPGAADRETLWRNLLEGVDSISRPGNEALAAMGVPPATRSHPDYVPAHGLLAGIDLFDPVPFGYTSGEASEIDPQQRLLLETAWHALEDAGCDPARSGPVAAFVGAGFGAYLHHHLGQRLAAAGSADRYALVLGNDKDYAATRLAYKLGLTGPAVAVQTACSTGLVAVALAVEALRAGRCRAALAGAVSLSLPAQHGYVYVDGGIGSRSGVCRPFDASADGTVGGSGVGVVVMKRLADALADGDTVHAVVRGVGLTNDGTAKAGFTAPTVEGQAAAIRGALTDAGVAPASVAVVEGHGTATALGDPIEIEALNIAYEGAAPGSIALGSVKGNIGHLDAAAGVAGLIKAVLTLRHGVHPPTVGYTRPNPRSRLADSPFHVSSTAVPLAAAGNTPLRAGVSSFGIGGTNVHVILEAPPASAEAAQETAPPGPQLLTLCAADARAGKALADALAGRLAACDAVTLARAAWTLQTGRRRQSWRRIVVAQDGRQAADRLRAAGPRAVIEGRHAGPAPAVALLFPGQGSQHPGMARALYRALPSFRSLVDQAAGILEGSAAAELPALLQADPADAQAARRLADTAVTQPALFVVEYALARTLADCGVAADAYAGHSVGEYVAASLAGVMTYEDALRLVAERGRLMAQAPRGAMLALSMSESEAQRLIEGTGLSLATINGARQCVVAGEEAAIAAVEAAATARDLPARRLNVSHAFHCALMDPVLEAFGAAVSRVTLRPPQVPFLSNLTGDWIAPGDATDPAYWVRHLRGTVRFADNLARLNETPERVFVEAGPGVTLTRLARAAGVEEGRAIAVQPGAGDGHEAFLEAIGRLWLRGIEPDWRALHGGVGRRRIPLPPYPFQRTRHWADAPTAAAPERVLTVVPVRPAPDGALDATARIWCEVMGRETIDPDADFLELGGDSLMALRIVTRMRERFGVQIPVAALLREPTVRAAAAFVRENGAPSPSPAKPIERERGVL